MGSAQKIDFDQAFSRLPATGWLPEDEARLLWDYATRTRGAILEVGSYHGRSAVLLGQLGRTVHCVDPFRNYRRDDISGEKTYRAFLENTKGLPCIVPHRMRIEDWPPRKVGFAYLDGDHSYEGTVNQIRKALACRPRHVAAHDVLDTGGAKTRQACLDLLGPWLARVGGMAVWKVGTSLRLPARSRS